MIELSPVPQKNSSIDHNIVIKKLWMQQCTISIPYVAEVMYIGSDHWKGFLKPRGEDYKKPPLHFHVGGYDKWKAKTN